MDHIVVKTERLERLSRIAEMATFHLMQSDLYITLAHALEEYMIQPTLENHTQVDQILSVCKKHFSNYDNLRTVLVGELEMNGNLQITNNKNDPQTVIDTHNVVEDDTPEIISDTPIITSVSDNITHVDFSKKR